MTSNQAQKKESAKKRVRFFNVSLRNGIVVSTPAYPEKQGFLAHLIRALERIQPRLRLDPVPLRQVGLQLSAGQAEELDAQGQGIHRAADN